MYYNRHNMFVFYRKEICLHFWYRHLLNSVIIKSLIKVYNIIIISDKVIFEKSTEAFNETNCQLGSVECSGPRIQTMPHSIKQL